MVRLAVLMVESRATAEDVVQDAFVAVDSRWSSLDRPGAYLRTCVINGCRAVLRRERTERRLRPRMAEPASVEAPTHLIELRSALDRLNERQRAVVVLRYFADLPDTEIAQILDCRESTVRSIASRSLAILRKELA